MVTGALLLRDPSSAAKPLRAKRKAMAEYLLSLPLSSPEIYSSRPLHMPLSSQGPAFPSPSCPDFSTASKLET
ncbi:hypothetical protein KFK09_009135 [Dendrobium nobile]|uniref:Uncharacterized protein n=1 Tax=Dendrobium nobile TaxID=94219 RepID=A0A8T3BRT7_DENNO|nr:hypothetical protein KFK09_009135 [Dendrobium nobile]